MEGAEKFVRSYYVTLRYNPYDLYLYYRQDCTMVRIDGDKQRTAKTGLKIMELLGSLDYMEFDIKSLHSSEPFKDGFIVTVLGSLHTRYNKVPRKFMETFVVTLKKNKYRFHSDVFQYVEKYPDVVFHVPSQEVEVAKKQAVSTAPRAEPPTIEVASRDGGVASDNSGEDSKLHSGNLPKRYDKAKITEIIKEATSPVARERAGWTARREEPPPTMEVASSDGVASVNSGEETRLHIGNLPTTYTKTEITQLVKEVASPVLVKIGNSKGTTQRRKRFAFVTMGTVEERDLVIAHLNGKECGDGVLKATVARTPHPRMDKS